MHLDKFILTDGFQPPQVLGYKNPQRAIREHVDDEDKGMTEIVTPGGKQMIPIINESGLYSLVFSSKLPTAKNFKHWVTSEVLPAIRQTGTYSLAIAAPKGERTNREKNGQHILSMLPQKP